MHKSALLLTAATFALLAGPALAATSTTNACLKNTDNLTDIAKQVKGPLCTSTADSGKPGDIVIETNGTVSVASVSGVAPTIFPAITIDSDNLVTDKGVINFTGTNNSIGIQLDTGHTGGFDLNVGTVDMLQAGTDKIGILITDGTSGSTGTFTGVAMPNASTPLATPTVIDLEAGSTFEIQGDGSIGIETASGNTVDGDIDIAGALVMTASKVNETSNSGTSQIGVELEAAMKGNFNVLSGGEISVTGPGSEGVVVAGELNGEFDNDGIISVTGTATPQADKTNATSGSAVVIDANIDHGFLNDGPINTSGVNSSGVASGTGIISSTGSAPTVLFSPATTANLVIAPVTDATNTNPLTKTGFSLLNRGTISSGPANPDVNATAMQIVGVSQTAQVQLNGGIFNSGAIEASANTKIVTGSSTATATATALDIGPFVVAPNLVNSNQSGTGDITASVSGAEAATAQAIVINSSGDTASPTGFGLHEIDNNQGSIISANASTIDTTNTVLIATAILDEEGSLTTINNMGTISATATTLNNDAQIAEAINVGVNTTGVNIVNGGSIVGDVILGGGADTLQIGGTAINTTNVGAVMVGDVFFGGDLLPSQKRQFDTLDIEAFGSFIGQVQEPLGNLVNVTVATGGALTLTNNGTAFDAISESGTCGTQAEACGLQANNFTTGSGSSLTLDVAQVFNQNGAGTGAVANPPAVISANSANIATGTNFGVGFGSFITAVNDGNSQFELVATPKKQLTIGNFQSLQNDIDNELPFLFDDTSALCTVNVASAPGSACAGTALPKNITGSALILNLDPKTAKEIGLTGFANTMFTKANLALANDTELGAAVLSAGLPVKDVPLTPGQGKQLYQQIYSAFAPDVTGSARAIAISLTDQGSGEVGARQRALRMYAGQDGDTTLWGQEFTQDLNVGNKTEAGGYDDTGFGFVLGADGGSPRTGRYGVAFQFYSGDTHEKSPRTDTTNSEWLMLTGYTDWRGKGFFLDSQGSIGYAQLKGQRFINVGPVGGGLCTSESSVDCDVSRDARGDRSAEFLSGGVTSGVLLAAGGLLFTPQVSLDGLTMREEGYTEDSNTSTVTVAKDQDGFDLTVKPNYMNSLRAFAGADLREDLNLGDFYLQPEVRAGYRYDFIDGQEKVKAAFVSQEADPANFFTITGPDPARANLVLGGGLAVTTGAWSVGVNYDYVKGIGGTKTLDQVGTFTLVGRL